MEPDTDSYCFAIITLTVIRYRKIPGDKCEGGVNPERKEIDMSKKCVSDLLDPQLQVRILKDCC